MSGQLTLIAAIRTGRLSKVKAALDAGAGVELHDGQGDPGLPMGIACFMGLPEIVRELAARGAKVSLDDNALPTSPLNMAIRGKRTEVVRTLLELGAELPTGMECGLSEQEIILAQWVAQRAGLRAAPADHSAEHPVVEEIEMLRCVGTDTMVLEADALRAAQDMR
ncbi:ankyrin repeat domain-containing protein [Quatrionicoccus australiensis]|uniref:ankyrin repeat domain-containing protein n=1 Tax=Quatrionicoccus australiensis TaxID=138118 RepID=UPI001CFBFDAF|nr:ankyrin repeat domain-containing protein [Quatrionicoccus australiensis]MCB4358986.1 ankyrin repeat domain-containing protein [Quatrionicoccus australiensis]